MTDKTVNKLTKQIRNMIQALPDNSPERYEFVASLLSMKASLLRFHANNGPGGVATQNACPPDDENCRPGDPPPPPNGE